MINLSFLCVLFYFVATSDVGFVTVQAQSPNQASLIAAWLYGDLNLTMMHVDGNIKEYEVNSEDARQTETCLQEYPDTLGNSTQNFGKLSEIYVNCVLKHSFKMTPKWISIDGKHEALRPRKYRRLSPTMKPSPATYSVRESEAPKPSTFIVKWIHNRTPDMPIDSTIKESMTEEESTSISVSVSWSVSVTASASLKVGFAKASTDISVGGSGSDTTTKEVTTTKTYHLEDNVGIDPNTSVKVIWTLFEQSMDASWSAYMIFSGYFAVGLEIDGKEDIWFLPLSDMAKYVSGFLEQEEEPGKLYVPIGGSIQGKRGVQSVTRAFAVPLVQIEDTENLIGKCQADLANDYDYQAFAID